MKIINLEDGILAETKDVMNEVGRRTQVAARTKAVGVARSVTNCVAIAKHPKGNAGVPMP